MPDKLLIEAGGVPASVLDQVTVTPDKVLSGEKFVNSDGDLQTGTLVNNVDGWELIGFGAYKPANKAQADNFETGMTWKTGYPYSNLPYGTYRVIMCLGQNNIGGTDLKVYLNGEELSAKYGTKWNWDDVQFTGSGKLELATDRTLEFRNPSGFAAAVLHKV